MNSPQGGGPSGLRMGEEPKNASPLEDEQIMKRYAQAQTTENWMRNAERMLGKILRGKRHMATKDGENLITLQPTGKMVYKRR
jgi:hypothetical protein